MEGGTYICRWKKEGRDYVLWLDDNPKLLVRDEDFDEASDELASQIIGWNGDGEAVLEFDPPRPLFGQVALAHRLLSLGYNESSRVLNRGPALFEDGICDRCQFGIGPRTAEPLRVDRSPRGDIGGIDRQFPTSRLLSEGFLNLLNDAERELIHIQPVIVARGRKKFFELTGPDGIRAVGVRGAAYPSAFSRSWVCHACGRKAFVVDHPQLHGVDTFLAADSLPTPMPSVLVFDDGFGLSIALTETRWKSIMRKPGAKGISTDIVGVIAPDLVEREPALAEPDEFDWIL